MLQFGWILSRDEQDRQTDRQRENKHTTDFQSKSYVYSLSSSVCLSVCLSVCEVFMNRLAIMDTSDTDRNDGQVRLAVAAGRV